MNRTGFTLIELSIVLVIIGLIVGGVLSGQTLINAARLRAQVSQIEKYQTAVNTFQVRFGALPGDIRDPEATRFGLIPRGLYDGMGDGNGYLEGVDSLAAGHSDGIWQTGENAVFWRDLSTAKLIDQNFSQASFASQLLPNGGGASGVTSTSSPALKDYIPEAKYRTGFYINTISTSPNSVINLHVNVSAKVYNYFVLEAVNTIELGYSMNGYPSVSVADAYNMDAKIDDGKPNTGIVSVALLSNSYFGTTAVLYGNPDTATTCYNNSTLTYSLSINNGAGQNCSLAFRMK